MTDMTFYQTTGEFYIGTEKLRTLPDIEGYAGLYNVITGEDHRNIAADQCLKNKGPLPRGLYRMSDAHHYKTKYSIWLKPVDSSVMCGRDGFMIHGGNSEGTSSEGCIILMRENRKKVLAAMKSDGTTILEVK